MAKVLVTGASGFIGSRLVPALQTAHDVVTVSRAPANHAGRHVQGSFMSEEVLEAATDPPPDIIVHLAAETGGCTEESGLRVNVAGTQRLLRYAVDRGVKRFVLASSIAAPIGLAPETMPLSFPIDDDHPSHAKDPYGLSKALMEEVAFYFHRGNPDLDITLFRLGVVLKEDAEPVSENTLSAIQLPLIGLSSISVVDVVTAIQLALDRPHSPGAHRMNLVAPWARTPIPTAEALDRLLGMTVADINTSYFESDEHRFSSPFAIERLNRHLDFTPTIDPRTMTATTNDESA